MKLIPSAFNNLIRIRGAIQFRLLTLYHKRLIVMKRTYRNPYTGRHSPGFRFCFHVRAIAHRPIFLPLVMKNHYKIQRLLKGESPLSVFECSSYQAARVAFSELRKKFDFAYWAITEYYIRDLNDADNIIPLHLNTCQNYLIDI